MLQRGGLQDKMIFNLRLQDKMIFNLTYGSIERKFVDQFFDDCGPEIPAHKYFSLELMNSILTIMGENDIRKII